MSDHTQGGHSETRLEADRPRNLSIALAILVGVLVVGGMIRGVDEFVHLSIREEQAAKLGAAPDALRTLRAQEAGRAARYQWIDRATNVVRIPAERALEIVLRERAAVPEGTTAPAAPAAHGEPGGEGPRP